MSHLALNTLTGTLTGPGISGTFSTTFSHMTDETFGGSWTFDWGSDSTHGFVSGSGTTIFTGIFGDSFIGSINSTGTSISITDGIFTGLSANTVIASGIVGAPAPEISVTGNGTNIVDGDATPSSADHTDFGTVAYGATVDHVFTVSNMGTADLTGSSFSIPDGFMVTDGLSDTIAPGTSDSFTVRLDTTSAGTKSGEISIPSNDSDENPFNFQISGIVSAPAPEISVTGNGTNIVDGGATPFSADNTDFGSAITGGAPVDHVFIVSNEGTAALTIMGLTAPTGFSIVDGLPASIAAGGSDSFTVRLDTTSAGTRSGQISLTSNDSDENPFNFSISGTVGSVEIGVSGNNAGIIDGDTTPSSADHTDFGSATRDGATLSRVFAVSNTGTLALTTSGLTVPDGFTVTEGLSASIAAGASDSFTVRLNNVVEGISPFSQLYIVAYNALLGTKSGQISFTTNDSDENPFNFSITGTVTTTLAPEIDVSGNGAGIAAGDATPSIADHTDFGSAAVGATVDRVFTVNNMGTAALTSLVLTLPTGFSLVDGLLDSIAAGGSDSFTVRLDTASAGTTSGQIILTSNDSDENPFNFSITGTVTPPPPDLSATNLTFNGSAVSYIVNDVGTEVAVASIAGIYLSIDGTITTSDTLLTTRPIPSIGVNGSYVDSVSVSLPGTLTPGSYFLGVIADQNGQIAETNEANNASNTVPIILGNSSDNALIGMSGNDMNLGLGGDDTLDGAAGADTMIGGAGNDTYVVDNVGDVVTENVNEGFDTIASSVTYSLPANVEGLGLLGTSNINATGNSAANVILGNSGINLLDGGAGADTMAGGAGSDFYVVDNVDDLVTENANEGSSDTVFSTVTYTLSANIEGLQLFGGDINGTGNSAPNAIVGSNGNNILDGGAGADTMAGGAGNDLYIVDNVLDRVIESAGEGTDFVLASVPWVLGANQETLVVGSLGHTRHGRIGLPLRAPRDAGQAIGIGNDADNTLVSAGMRAYLAGMGGNDVLFGGAGDDVLAGGLGNDTLYGGAGADLFVFAEAAGVPQADVVMDFRSGHDRIVLAEGFFFELGASGGFQANDERFHAGAGIIAAQDANDRILYNTTTGKLYYDADGIGGSATALVATLSNRPVLSATDLVVG